MKSRIYLLHPPPPPPPPTQLQHRQQRKRMNSMDARAKIWSEVEDIVDAHSSDEGRSVSPPPCKCSQSSLPSRSVLVCAAFVLSRGVSVVAAFSKCSSLRCLPSVSKCFSRRCLRDATLLIITSS